ncbi:MAG TPA: family 16 glycoside hydrolase, partial [Gemmataceae bacterium]
NLLFRQSDFQAPAESPLFKELLTIGDAQAQTLVKELHRACQGPLDDVPLLTDLVSEEKPAGKTKTATPTIVKATAVQPAAASAEAGSAWAFEREGKAPSRRQRKGGVPRWVWGVAGGGTAAFVVLGGIFALAFQGETEKPKDKARIARKQPEKPPQRPVKSQEQTAPKEEQPEGDGQRKEGDVPPPPVVPDVPESNGVSDPPTANAKLEAVARELKVHNPGFEGTWAKAPGIEGDKIVSLVIQSDHVRDLTPLQDLPHLRQLTLNGTKVTDLTPLQGLPLSWLAISYSPVSDLSPLSGMKGLESLFVTAAPLIDLKPLEGLKLRELGLHATQVEDLSPLKGMPLKGLNIHRTRVKDLSPLKGMKLEGFCFYEQPVKDISVLKDMPLRDVGCPFQRERDEAVLRSIKTLKTINRKPAAQFWKEVDSTNTSGGSPTKGGQIPPKSPNVATEEKGFVPLFNGKDLTGWKTHPDDKPKWEVKDGILIGSGVGGHLFSERGDYENFHFRVEAMINDGGNSGQYFRTAFGPGFPKGYEAQINSTHADPIKTGSLYPAFSGKLTQEQRDKIIVRDMLVKPDEWFTQEVIARGNHIIIKVNDKTTVDFVDRNNTYTKGHFALQQHDLATVVKFRKIEVKELPAKAAESSPLRAQSDHPPEAKEVAAKAYEKACKDARAKLLKAFDTVLDQLAKRKGSIEARLKLIDTLKAEKTRFEYPGLIPWSAPMRPHVDQYLAELTVAQDKFRRAYNSLIDAQLRAKNESKVDDLRAELKKRIDVQVMAKWRYYLNGREVALHTLYSNGKIGNIYGKATWTYAKGVLTFRFPAPNGPGGAWIDTLNVSADGTTCAGTNNAPAGKGPKLTGVYVNDN